MSQSKQVDFIKESKKMKRKIRKKIIWFVLIAPWILSNCSQITSKFYISNQEVLNSTQGDTISIVAIKMSPPEYLNQFEEMVWHAFRYAFYTKNKKIEFIFNNTEIKNSESTKQKSEVLLGRDNLSSEPPSFLSKYLNSNDKKVKIGDEQELTEKIVISQTSQSNFQDRDGTVDKVENNKKGLYSNGLIGEIYLIYNLKNDPSQLTPVYSLTIGLSLYSGINNISDTISSKKTIANKYHGFVTEGQVSVAEVEFVDFQLIQKMAEALVASLYEAQEEDE